MLKMNQFVIFLSLAVLGIGLGGCHTIEGAGQDIEEAGETVQDAAH